MKKSFKQHFLEYIENVIKTDISTRWVGRRWHQRLVRRFWCSIGKHVRQYWSPERCQQEHVYAGGFTPWECSACGTQSQIFKIGPAAQPPVDNAHVAPGCEQFDTPNKDDIWGNNHHNMKLKIQK